MEPALVTGNATVDHWLAVAGMVVTVASGIAAVLNAKIRAALDAGDDVPAVFLYVALVVNTVAVNIDKAAQMQRLLRGGSVVVTRVDANKPEVKP